MDVLEPQLDLVDYLNTNADRFPCRVALVHGNCRLTFEDLRSQAATLAARFTALGLPGRAVGIYSPTIHELAIVYYAGFMSGTIVVPINYSFRYQELRNVLDNCPLQLLFVHSSLLTECSKVGGVLDSIPLRYQIGPAIDEAPGFLPFESLMERCEAAVVKAPDKPSVIFHTSGTTGKPKGVIHTLESISYFGRCYQLLSRGDPNPVTLIARNCYHSGGFYHLTGALSAGTTCILADDPAEFDAERFIDTLEAQRVSQIFLSVSMLNSILSASNLSPRAFAHAVFISVGADEVSAFHHEALRRYTHLPLSVRYSSTEATCISINTSGLANQAHSTSSGQEEVGSVGIPFPHFRWMLDPVPDGNGIGELLLAGNALFRGYLNNAEANAASFTQDGWYRTGDLFKTSESGHLLFRGRRHDTIKVGGKLVYPEEVEAVANSYPIFLETVAVPVPHAIKVQVPYLFARKRVDAGTFDPDDFVKFMTERLAQYKVPTGFQIISTFPMTAGDKVDRRRLIQIATLQSG